MSELTYRPAMPDDAALAADLMSSAYPDLPEDPVILRYRWENPRQKMSFGRFIAAMGGRPVAYLTWFHGPWETEHDRYCEVEVDLDRAVLTTQLATKLFSWITVMAEAEGAGKLIAYAGENQPEMLAAIANLGFEQDRVDRLWELDLHADGERLTREAKRAREQAAEEGIQFVTLAAWSHLKKIELLHELDSITRRDIPHTAPIVIDTPQDFQRRISGPGRHHDRHWIALDDERPVSMSYLFFPPVRGPVSTGYTCTHPDYRGRGLARSTKLQSLAQAVELGIRTVITDNDSENVAMLRINEKLGHRLRPGFVGHLKRVSKS
jgi:RimJ/RimL family protein N-acetyltransferase